MFRSIIHVLGMVVMGATSMVPYTLLAAEWEQYSPYYEDDAWYDVSEWLDGNDYNPTDEKFGRWDDEVYDSDSGDYDYDNDVVYGYNDSANDSERWFYDYWNPAYSTYSGNGPTYDYAYRYYDYDNDGAYDSYTSYYDWDQDGWFEDVNHYTFDSWTDNSSHRNKANQTAKSDKKERVSSKANELNGTVENSKQVSVRGIKHLVIELKQENGEKVAADLGPQSHAKKLGIQKGTTLTVRGPIMAAGEKKILLAKSVTINGKKHEIDRDARNFQGRIVDSHKTKVKGHDHTLVLLKTKDGKQRLVDLGRSDRLDELDLRNNSQITVRGVPFKIKNRPFVMGQSVDVNGSTAIIDRKPDKKS